MRFLVASLLVVFPGTAGADSVRLLHAAAAAPAEQASPDHCPPTAASLAAQRRGKPEFHRLTELPPADMYSAVYRRDANGCERPIIVRYNVGQQR